MRRAQTTRVRAFLPPFACCLVLPKPVEPTRCHLRVPNSVLYLPVSEIMLQRAGIVACVGQLEAASVPQQALST